MLSPEGRCRGIAGPTGFGKSTLARAEVLKLDRVIVVEPHDSKSDYEGVIRFKSVTEMEFAIRCFGERGPRTFRVAVAPGLTWFPRLCAVAWKLGDVTLVLEETGKYFGPGKYYPAVGEDGKRRLVPVPQEFVEICERGRHAGPDEKSPVSVLALAQRASRIPDVLKNELATFYAFRIPLDEDRRWLKTCPGSSVEISEATKDLPKFNYLKIDCENGGFTRETTTP